MEKRNIPWIIIPGILLVDQVSKILVKLNMTLGQSIPVFGDWFQIHFTENYGMAFGLEFSGEYGKLFLSLLRIVAVIAIGWYICRLVRKEAPSGLIASISLIMAGAIGNIIDSSFYGLIFSESHFNQAAELFPKDGGYGTLLHGKVVDLFYFPIIRGNIPEWIPIWGGQPFIFFRPVFNVADSAITIGVLIMIIFQKKFFAHEKKTATSEHETPGGTETPAGNGDPQSQNSSPEPGPREQQSTHRPE